jgi:hypothetical protein
VALLEAASLPEQLAKDPVDMVFNIVGRLFSRPCGRDAQRPRPAGVLGIPE